MATQDLNTISLFSQTEDVDTAVKPMRKAPEDPIAEAYWKKCIKIIKDNVSSRVFKTWFEPIKAFSHKDDTLTVQVTSQFICEWIEEHFYSLLRNTLSQVLGNKAKLQYQIVIDDNSDSLENRTIKVPALKYPTQVAHNETLHHPAGAASINNNEHFHHNLNPRYTLDSYISGESNQLAHSAAQAISNKPGSTRFNPFVLYGETGLGKTHLVQGIGNYIIEKRKDLRVLYTTSEQFTMEFVNAIKNNSSSDFVNYYRSIDVLIVDDIQFFSGKERTQDNFFHTFNALHQAGKQLILTSDRPPRDLSNVDDRLISRFQWGLIADIQAPDFEMRMAILMKKSQDEGMELPHDVNEYIARHVKSSIRELEGTLISLLAKVTLDGRTLDLDLAKEVVHGIANVEPQQLSVEDIKELVAKYYELDVSTLESKSRKHEIALARQMSIYLTKQFTQHSLKTIGKHFGNRDHSTVLYSCRMIEDYLTTEKVVKVAYEYFLKKLKKD
ncbi:MAG: chromosomal replication initiator protein DnaA [Candidatus Kapabacteria bacterium]|nr:chromosomal replication initiator protein DnaA [Candidatus Kapabacteria bacterium]